MIQVPGSMFQVVERCSSDSCPWSGQQQVDAALPEERLKRVDFLNKIQTNKSWLKVEGQRSVERFMENGEWIMVEERGKTKD